MSITIIPENININFLKYGKFFTSGSFILICFTILMFFKKGFNYGVDFTGGAVVQAKFSEVTNAEKVRNLVARLGEKDPTVVAIGSENKEFLITVRTEKETTDIKPLDKKLVEEVGADKINILQVDMVGPKVGKELRSSAILSIFYTLIFIMIYIWFRFEFKFAPGATIALIHDLIMMCGFYIITGKEFTISSVAALLTIAGYSINDTIVIYDRVRELLAISGGAVSLENLVNQAINKTLSRTIITSGTTAIAVLPLAIFVTGDIGSFAEAMLVGIVFGTYSTIYIASTTSIFIEKIMKKNKTA